MNKWIGIGRLVADPEIRSTQNGTPVATYRLAIDRTIKKEGQPEADFINCVAWNKNADFVSKYLTKGMKIAVEGRIQTRAYENKDGQKVYVTEILVERHEFCESKKQTSGQLEASIVQPETDTDFTVISDDDDLPF